MKYESKPYKIDAYRILAVDEHRGDVTLTLENGDKLGFENVAVGDEDQRCEQGDFIFYPYGDKNLQPRYMTAQTLSDDFQSVDPTPAEKAA